VSEIKKTEQEISANALYMHEWRKNNREKVKQSAKRSWDAIRLECLQHYSGQSVPVCRCCGETGFKFLHLDHSFGNGAEHRRSLKGIECGSGCS
jgi:hypothetical protein